MPLSTAAETAAVAAAPASASASTSAASAVAVSKKSNSGEKTSEANDQSIIGKLAATTVRSEWRKHL